MSAARADEILVSSAVRETLAGAARSEYSIAACMP